MEVNDRSLKQSNNLPSRSNFHVKTRKNVDLNQYSKMTESKYQSSKYLETYNYPNQSFNTNGNRRISSQTFEFLQKGENLRPSQTTTSSYIRRDSKISKAEGNPTKTQPKTPNPLFQKKKISTQNKRNSRNITQTSIDTSNSFQNNNYNYLSKGSYYRFNSNVDQKKEKPAVKNKENKIDYIYGQKKMEDKENLDQNVKKILKEYLSDDNKTEIIKPKYYLNERGGVVFKSSEPPTTSIVIMNTKPDYSRYQNNSKILGKNKNIEIYEAPAPEKKVTIRSLDGKRK